MEDKKTVLPVTPETDREHEVTIKELTIQLRGRDAQVLEVWDPIGEEWVVVARKNLGGEDVSIVTNIFQKGLELPNFRLRNLSQGKVVGTARSKQVQIERIGATKVKIEFPDVASTNGKTPTNTTITIAPGVQEETPADDVGVSQRALSEGGATLNPADVGTLQRSTHNVISFDLTTERTPYGFSAFQLQDENGEWITVSEVIHEAGGYWSDNHIRFSQRKDQEPPKARFITAAEDNIDVAVGGDRQDSSEQFDDGYWSYVDLPDQIGYAGENATAVVMRIRPEKLPETDRQLWSGTVSLEPDNMNGIQHLQVKDEHGDWITVSTGVEAGPVGWTKQDIRFNYYSDDGAPEMRVITSEKDKVYIGKDADHMEGYVNGPSHFWVRLNLPGTDGTTNFTFAGDKVETNTPIAEDPNDVRLANIELQGDGPYGFSELQYKNKDGEWETLSSTNGETNSAFTPLLPPAEWIQKNVSFLYDGSKGAPELRFATSRGDIVDIKDHGPAIVSYDGDDKAFTARIDLDDEAFADGNNATTITFKSDPAPGLQDDDIDTVPQRPESLEDEVNVLLIGLSGGETLTSRSDAIADLEAQQLIHVDTDGTITFRPGNFSDQNRFDIFKASVAADPGTATRPSDLLENLGIGGSDQARIDELGDDDGYLDATDIPILVRIREELGDVASFLRAPDATAENRSSLQFFSTSHRSRGRGLPRVLEFAQPEIFENIRMRDPVSPFTTGKKTDISGVIWEDRNGNRIIDSGEDLVRGAIVFKDDNANGKYDYGEVYELTDIGGHYKFDRTSAGTFMLGADARSRPGLPKAQDRTNHQVDGISGIRASMARSAARFRNNTRRDYYGHDLSVFSVRGENMTGNGVEIFLFEDHFDYWSDPKLSQRKFDQTNFPGSPNPSEFNVNHAKKMSHIITNGAPDAHVTITGGTVGAPEVLELTQIAKDNPSIPFVFNMSSSSNLETTDRSEELLKGLDQDNITIVVAMGNNRDSPIYNQYLRLPNVIAVGGQDNGYSVHPGSGFSPKVTTILDAQFAKRVFDGSGTRLTPESTTATSGSTAYMSSVIAVMQEYAKLKHGRFMRADEVRTVLNRSGRKDFLRRAGGPNQRPGTYRALYLRELKRAIDVLFNQSNIVVSDAPGSGLHLDFSLPGLTARADVENLPTNRDPLALEQALPNYLREMASSDLPNQIDRASLGLSEAGLVFVGAQGLTLREGTAFLLALSRGSDVVSRRANTMANDGGLPFGQAVSVDFENRTFTVDLDNLSLDQRSHIENYIEGSSDLTEDEKQAILGHLG
ncbi:S8/S53 family peptidase [uncultured Roseobacter sp.]|uniref:S8/S53 family peptidase n=1 Tax=uncultured Roseobacter sp. TaxID=114847 RepID=UPI002633C603|nr:S8/S53 family peptidase [uncultured Roseobacter sp.]